MTLSDDIALLLSEKVYLGDAVYAQFDGYHIILTLGDGSDARIALEPDVLTQLKRYAARIDDIRKHKFDEDESP